MLGLSLWVSWVRLRDDLRGGQMGRIGGGPGRHSAPGALGQRVQSL